jgi:ankyrin repeat protein
MISPSKSDLLNTAIKAKNLAGIRTLLKSGVNPNGGNLKKRSALEVAALTGSIEAVGALLSAGSVIRDDDKILHCAVDGGSFEVLQKILNAIPPATKIGAAGTYTPLMNAAFHGHLNMCRLLVARGSDPKAIATTGRSLLSYALFNKGAGSSSESIIGLVEFLIEAGAEVNPPIPPDMHSPLGDAIVMALGCQKFVDEKLGQKVCELLIKHGADLNSAGACESALHLALEPNTHLACDSVFDPSLIPLFIKSGADVNVKDQSERTPLHLACIADNDDAIRQLVASGTEINAVDEDFRTALHFATSVSTARTLLEAGIDPTILDSSGATAEDCAACDNRLPEVHAFLKSIRTQAELEMSVSSQLSSQLRQRI